MHGIGCPSIQRGDRENIFNKEDQPKIRSGNEIRKIESMPHGHDDHGQKADKAALQLGDFLFDHDHINMFPDIIA